MRVFAAKNTKLHSPNVPSQGENSSKGDDTDDILPAQQSRRR